MRGAEAAPVRSVSPANARLSPQVGNDEFEDLKNEMKRRYGFVGVANAPSSTAAPSSGSGSLSSLSTSGSVTTSVDRATASFETVRAFCDEQRTNGTTTWSCELKSEPTHSTCPGVAIPASRRAFSTSCKEVKWSEIPPLIPPREPVRSRHSPPQRHSSTPSPTSMSPMTSLSSSPLPPTTRPKYQTQSSTTTIFSALPPSMTGSNPVILPIMKDGKQDSSTHYYLLPEEKVTTASL